MNSAEKQLALTFDYSGGDSADANGESPTVALLVHFLTQWSNANGGLLPDRGECDPATWAHLAHDFMDAGAWDPKTRITVKGVPVAMNPYMKPGQIVFMRKLTILNLKVA